MTTAAAARIRLRLFVEGVEIPCISCQVQAQPNSPVMASVQIPPLPEATRFMPRSLVHVFFWDDYERNTDDSLTMTGDSVHDRPGPSVFDQVKKNVSDRWETDQEGANSTFRVERGLHQYKLVFVGELVGFGWTKNTSSRSIVLQCADLSNYWDHAFQCNNGDLFGPGMKAMFSGGARNEFTDFLEEPGGAVVRIIMTPSARFPNLQGLLGGIVHLLEAMGGSYYYGKKFAGQNIFFSIAELRLHITQMITAYTKDQTAKRLLGGGYDALFGRSIGDLGDQASFRKVVNMLMSVIFHETYGQPCPRYVPGFSGSISGLKTKKMRTMRGTPGQVAQNALGLVVSLDEAVDFMGEYSSNLPQTDDEKEIAKYRKEHVANTASRLAAVQRECGRNAQLCKDEIPRATRAGVPKVSAAMETAAGLFRSAASACGKAVSTTSPTAYSSKIAGGKVLELVKQAADALRKIPELEAVVTPVSDAVPAMLNQQIFRPDIWFSAPPRCNVIFPEQYSSLTYSRKFLEEPTRLLLKTNDEFFGEDELFDNFYFAPKAITVQQEKNTLQALLRGDIMDHELFTGILPVFEKMGEFNIFAARSGLVNGKTPKVGLAQRSTNFLYFKYRFAARQLQLSGKFNPYVAVGFPGLIIDKYVDIETLKAQADLIKSVQGDISKTSPNVSGLALNNLLPMLGTHFLASFTEVSHQIDQQQGTTSINCSYARQPEESVEFLGNVQDEIEVIRKRKDKVARPVTVVAAINPPRVDSFGPTGGRIINVVDVTDKYPTPVGGLHNAPKLPLFGGPRDPKTKQLASSAPVGYFAPAGEYDGTDVVNMVGSPDIIVRLRAYEITEEKSQQVTEKVDLPPEEYIRPGWYGDCWHPSQISDVYYEFFDTGAITEPTAASHGLGAYAGKGYGDIDLNPQMHGSSDAEQTLADMLSGSESMKFAQDQILSLALTKDSSIQQAVAFLVLTYSVIKQAGFSADNFIRTYTWRPIATMLDMFGSSDLQLDAEGKDVVQGIEGFHSRSFGPFDDLFGLVTNEIENIVGVQKNSTQAQKSDTRKRKFEAVLLYAASLRSSKAILG